MNALQKYAHYFSTLNRASLKGERAPHKIIMLLAVIDLVGQGHISSPAIVLDDRLKQQFNLLWSRYVGESSVFTPVARTPFIHMDFEPFWRLRPNGPRQPLCAEIDEELYNLLQDENDRAYFRRLLIGLI